MISSNTRGAARSRFSSPAQPVNGNGNGNGNGSNDHSKSSSSTTKASRDFMQRWLEPTVQAKASFEDDGLVRYGVVENMAPLGVLPKSKKSSSETGSSVRKIILRPSGGNAANSASEPAPEAPASASPPHPPTDPSTPPRRKSIAVKIPADDDDEDEDYHPKPQQKRRQSARASLGRHTRRSSGGRRSSMTSAMKPVSPKETKPLKEKEANEEGQSTRAEPQDKEFTDKVIESAVDEALKHYRYPTAWALRTLYDENSHDPAFVAMIEDVFNQTADTATMRKFSNQMEEKKREGKKDDRGCYYFIPPSTNNRFPPHKPKMAPYGKLLRSNQKSSLDQNDNQNDNQNQDREKDEAQKENRMEAPQPEERASKRAKTSHSGNTHSRSHSHSHAQSHATRDTPQKMARNRNGLNGEPGTPSRDRPRRDSASSDSSLSSAMSLSSPEVSVASISPGRRARTNRPGPDSSDAPKSQPITTRRKSLASKSRQSKSSPSALNSSTQQVISSNNSAAHASASASMPGRVSAALLLPDQSTKSSRTTKGKTPTPGAGPGTPDEYPANFWERRREARRFVGSVTAEESSVRGTSEEQPVTPVKKGRKTRQSIGVPPTTRSTRSASKRPHDEPDIAVSPVAWSFTGEGSSTVGSRAVTPTLRPAKKQRSGLRVKSSPVKKRGGTAAGLPRSNGDSSAAGGTSRDQATDNEEDCSACGAAGDVVCCDGCPRSFHFECVGMSRSDPLPDEWFCNECYCKRFPSRLQRYSGVFATALSHLDRCIPRSFSLPKALQERFEGVKAGADGEYEEVSTSKPTKKRPGYEEVVDFFRQREDGQPVLCHGCQKSATDVRAIMSCSVCPSHWHLDCLDPPLAMPPPPKTWKCPLHVDELWSQAQRLAPAHRFRKIKDSPAITPAFSRGLKNNGFIEVGWSGEPEQDNNTGWPDPVSYGRKQTLEAHGIVLDFIEQLRREGAGYGPNRDEQRWVGYLPMPVDGSNRPIRGSDVQRTVEEIQVSLALNSMKVSKSDNIDQLVLALLQNADPNVVTLMAKNSADNFATGSLTDNDKIGLRALLAQMDAMSARVREILGEAPPSTITAAMFERGTELPNILSPEESVIEATGKMTPTSVREPTSPATADHLEGPMDLD
ncbi:hypothetical protein BGZ63DRAFT_349263 [Mariannaea sp. PMI_226]|nr:hypothetical protein BGZ63DRAFT_349263 [Mariannaea sp. PMI_226]